MVSARKINLKDKRLLFFVPGFAFYLAMVFIALPASNPRYLLVLVPFGSLVFARAFFGIKKRKFGFALFFVFAGLLLVQSVPLALEIHNTASPPVQAINYINENYGPGDFISLRGADIIVWYFDYCPLEVERLYATSCAQIKSFLSENRAVLSLRPESQCSELKIETVAVFKRDIRVHTKYSTVVLYKFALRGTPKDV